MRFSLQSSFLLLLVTIVIAIALSFLSLDQIFVSLKTRLENGEPSSLHGFLIHALDKGFCSPTTQQDHEEDDWNLFYHLGGNGPWIEKVDARYGTYEKDGTAPPGCVIDQVHMVRKLKGEMFQRSVKLPLGYKNAAELPTSYEDMLTLLSARSSCRKISYQKCRNTYGPLSQPHPTPKSHFIGIS